MSQQSATDQHEQQVVLAVVPVVNQPQSRRPRGRRKVVVTVTV